MAPTLWRTRDGEAALADWYERALAALGKASCGRSCGQLAESARRGADGLATLLRIR